MLKAVLIFGTGLYAGVYIAQNYQMDKVDDPQSLFNKAKTYVEGLMSSSSSKDCGDKKK